MPTYDYACKSCGTEWEENLSVDDRNKPTENPCPHCEATGEVEKILSTGNPLIDPIKLGRFKGLGNPDVTSRINEIRKMGSVKRHWKGKLTDTNITQI